MKYEVNPITKRRSSTKVSYAENEEDLDKWKDYRNKSLVELLGI